MTPEFPLSSDNALRLFEKNLNDYEKQEISEFSGKIYYLGQHCNNKVKGHVIKMVANTNVKVTSKDRRNSTVSNSKNC